MLHSGKACVCLAIILATSDAEKQTPAARLLAMYRRRAKQYEEEALEAENAAKSWEKKTEAAVEESRKEAETLTHKALKDQGVDVWANAAWEFDYMMNDPHPAQAAAAAAKAVVPYQKLYANYVSMQNSYDTAAVGYALRAKSDSSLAKQLQTYANQYKFQGDKAMSDTYEGQATILMKQANTFKGIADDYSKTAHRIYRALPTMQAMTGAAGAYAAAKANPGGALPPGQLFPFTPAPPLLDTVG